MAEDFSLQELARHIVDLEEAIELHRCKLLFGRAGMVEYMAPGGMPQSCDFCNGLRGDLTALPRVAQKLKKLRQQARVVIAAKGARVVHEHLLASEVLYLDGCWPDGPALDAALRNERTMRALGAGGGA